MHGASIKALIALIPISVLFAGSVVIWLRRKSIATFLQFLGAACLAVVALTHVFEALDFFLWMGWGSEDSVGHYLDLLCAILGFSLFSAGYLIHAVTMRREE
ncbi:MAG: hypothetical protein J2P56_06065 [Verrucomicrobia bacterium]|nr:hypothetical protein [Verrucomicrobiota bacterium]